MVTAARGLERPEPPPSLWPAVEGAMARHERPWWLSLRLFGSGALAGAVAVSVVALGLASWRTHRATAPIVAPVAAVASADPLLNEAEAEFASAAAAYERSIEKLRGLLAREEPRWSPAERARCTERLASSHHSIEKLRGLLEREEPRWSPAERARCTERLAQLDDAIATSRELAHRSPGDTVGNEQLFAAYQQKITFLAEAVHRGGTFGEGEPPR